MNPSTQPPQTLLNTPSTVLATVSWADPSRENDFQNWLKNVSTAHHLLPATLRSASADASFRRYFRIDHQKSGSSSASLIIMDAPTAQENSQPFVDVARLMAQAGLQVPDILAWDEAQGFMLLTIWA